MKNYERDKLGRISNPVINGDLFKRVLLESYIDRLYVIGWYKYNSRTEVLKIRRDFSMFDQMRMSKGKELLLDYITEEDCWKIHKFLSGQN